MLSEEKNKFLDNLKMDDYESTEEIAEVVKKKGINSYEYLYWILGKVLLTKSLNQANNSNKRSN